MAGSRRSIGIEDRVSYGRFARERKGTKQKGNERSIETYGAGSGGWVTKMRDAHEAGEISYALAIFKDLGGHAISLALVYPASRRAGRHAAGILPTVLEIVQALV